MARTNLGHVTLRRGALVGTAVALTGGLLSLGGQASAAPHRADCPSPKPLSFEWPTYVDTQLSGGEPVSIVANDKSIIVQAHYGTTLVDSMSPPDPNWVENYRGQTLVYRSADDGRSWSRITGAIPGTHTTESSGFSDPDLAKDSAGNIYAAEINLANDTIFSSHDNGLTWPDGNPLVQEGGDRPWLAARGPGEVYYLLTGSLQKSTDGGKTFTKLTDPPNAYGKLYVDPTDPKGLYVGTKTGIDVSRDDGQTWTSYDIPDASNDRSVMDSIGVDKQGWVYYGYIERSGSTYTVHFASFDPHTSTWSQPTTVARSSDPLMWAWTVAGDAGRAAVAWYDPRPVAGKSGTYDIHVMMAVTTDGRGSAGSCDDGDHDSAAPQFSTADAAGRTIYEGPIPCNGTGCNLTGDRRLGDYFTINFDASGRPFVITGDTMIPGPLGQPDTVSHPLFMLATPDSPRLLAGP